MASGSHQMHDGDDSPQPSSIFKSLAIKDDQNDMFPPVSTGDIEHGQPCSTRMNEALRLRAALRNEAGVVSLSRCHTMSPRKPATFDNKYEDDDEDYDNADSDVASTRTRNTSVHSMHFSAKNRELKAQVPSTVAQRSALIAKLEGGGGGISGKGECGDATAKRVQAQLTARFKSTSRSMVKEASIDSDEVEAFGP